jgi:hypothetical protein
MAALWSGIVTDSVESAMPAFFPLSAYVQAKSVGNPADDYRNRLVAAYQLDIHAAHDLLGSQAADARFLRVAVPRQWAWISPGSCSNDVGYWHAPGSRLVYEADGQIRSFGVFSLISWRGQWYVVHLSSYDHPGTVDAPSIGRGTYGPPGGC